MGHRVAELNAEAKAHLKRGSFQEAYKHLHDSELLLMQGTSVSKELWVDTYLNLGKCYEGSQQTDLALHYLFKALRLSKKQKGPVHLEVAAVMRSLKKPRKALVHARAALQQQSSDLSKAYLACGHALESLNQKPAASRKFNLAWAAAKSPRIAEQAKAGCLRALGVTARASQQPDFFKQVKRQWRRK